MKFLTINTDYPEFLQSLYSKTAGLRNVAYDEQIRVRVASLFSEADFYSRNFRRLGHEAWDIQANNEFAQKAWAREHDVTFTAGNKWTTTLNKVANKGMRIADRTPLRSLKPLYGKGIRPVHPNPDWFYEILAAQIEHYKPDVINNQSLTDVDSPFFQRLKPHYGFLMGQQAATPLPVDIDLSAYELFISSFPPTLEYFKKRGFPAEQVKLCFEPDILSSLVRGKKQYDISFIGSLYPIHSTRIELLETLCETFPQMKIWGPGINNLKADSPIRKCYIGQAWGKEMYQILYDSKITINHHGNIPPYANNLRLYEATGVGTMLITDWKNNLSDIFVPDREIVAYKNVDECVRQIKYYLEHEDEREAIAKEGHARTLKDHTYYIRMQELIDVVRKYA